MGLNCTNPGGCHLITKRKPCHASCSYTVERIKDPIDEIGRICDDAEPDRLSRIAAVLGMDKVEAKRDGLRARWRPEVVWFADAMERKLRANDWKGHWHHCRMQYLSMRLTQERKELYAAIADGDASKVLDECADVANFAMMIADKVRGSAVPSGVQAGSPGADSQRNEGAK